MAFSNQCNIITKKICMPLKLSDIQVHFCFRITLRLIEIFTIHFFISSGFLLPQFGWSYPSSFHVKDKRTVIELSFLRSLVWYMIKSKSKSKHHTKKVKFSLKYYLVNVSRSVNKLVYLRINNFKDNLIFGHI